MYGNFHPFFAPKYVAQLEKNKHFAGSNHFMSKQIIQTEHAPAPIGPYNQAVKAGQFLFISGQICLNPVTGELNNEDLASETTQVMENLKAILAQANLHFNDVVKSTIFLSDMQFFSMVNDIYGSYFSGNYPARETVAVKELPRAVRVEISMIAVASV
jgi:2-iminobutanoate/2-iminopropanoate deaminase